MIIAALPAYNEEVAIGSIVLRARKHVDKVIVVDDGSTDATAEVAKLAGAEVIRHERNLGKGAALKSAFMKARELDVDIIVCLDADGQHDPDEIPALLAPIKEGKADLVNGSRFLNGESKIPFYRRLGLFILTKLTNFGGSNVTDSQSGFRAFSRRTFDVFKFEQNSFSIESEMLLEANEKGLRTMEIPIGCRYDVRNPSTESPIKHGMQILTWLIRQVQQKHPLLYFGVPGVVMFVVGLVLGAQTMYGYQIYKTFWIGKAMMAIVFTLFGAFFAFTALILNSISTLIASPPKQ